MNPVGLEVNPHGLGVNPDGLKSDLFDVIIIYIDYA
jgi:hypothetical protein